MKTPFVLILVILFFSFSEDQPECGERSLPYWYNGINSRVEGENITIRRAFAELQEYTNNIYPVDGFITLRLHISKTGKLCDMEVFEIDKDYQKTSFNQGELARELQMIAIELKDWKRDKELKTYNLIRFKIKDGKIEEIF
ncbi:hypothetical protein SAMN02927921_01446 [Sinomicrobium oceani]|uniref:TonB protein C-terminal n=1 Tax=Sinomicrobium oceani TaxID=1150368 RepID=A0A1K1NTU0_9FLAO|nr:hypothetical protein [Sinomicrobium oceani]SFW38735.1 hypothetical protein SAMN02927921_01446 [Sinomicrobium oceani]